MTNSSILSLNKEGYLYIGVGFIISLLSFVFSWGMGMFTLLITGMIAYFFRDPNRIVPDSEEIVVSPCDGKICGIDLIEASEAKEIFSGKDGPGEEKEIYKVSIFLNVLDVHVNRIPATGVITKETYAPGKFFPAQLDKASEFNERQFVYLRTNQGKDILFVQIAGLIARRIVCNVTENQRVAVGDRFGIIKFGSRMEVYLPAGVEPSVSLGQTVVAGETIIAWLAPEENKGNSLTIKTV